MDRRIERAYDILKRDYQQDIKLHGLADRVGLSPFHFQKLFKKEIGETPAECLVRIRLDRAIHLMVIDPNTSVSQLAANCGYNSLSAFSRAFSHRFRISPRAYLNTMAKHPTASRTGVLDVEVIYFPATVILYEHANMFKGGMEKEFEKAENFCRRKNLSMSSRRFGVLTHIAFHGPRDRLNYYAGVPVLAVDRERYADRIFTIPEGKYAAFTTESSYDEFLKQLMTFKYQWLDQSKYLIREIFVFEEILKLSDLSEARPVRRVYVPIKPKG